MLGVVESFDEEGSKARGVRCGSCAGCTGQDCGSCVNCLDKPRFGGMGVKKQACFARRCVQIKAHRDDAVGMLAARANKRMKESATSLGFQHEFHELNELDEVDLPSDINQALHMIALPLPSKRSADGEAAPSHRARTASQKGEAHANASGRPKASGGVKGDSAKRRGTLQRCGQCVPCTRADCGQCQNCMDKPKFGGPGLRKQACEKKRCLTMTTRFATPSPPADAIASSNGIKSDSPTGAEKFVAPSTMFSSSLSQGMQGMASAWTLQLDQLQQLSHAGAAAPLPALRTGMASGLGYSLQGLESNGLLGGSFGAISGAMGSIGGLGNLGHGLGNLGNNGITLGEVPAPAAAHVSARHGASANAAPVASHVADGVPVFAYPAPRATHAPSQCPGFAPLGAEHPFVRRHPALEVPEDSFATADSFSTSLGFTDGVGSIGGSPRAEWDDGKSAADDNNDIVIEEDYNSWLADDY